MVWPPADRCQAVCTAAYSPVSQPVPLSEAAWPTPAYVGCSSPSRYSWSPVSALRRYCPARCLESSRNQLCLQQRAGRWFGSRNSASDRCESRPATKPGQKPGSPPADPVAATPQSGLPISQGRAARCSSSSFWRPRDTRRRPGWDEVTLDPAIQGLRSRIDCVIIKHAGPAPARTKQQVSELAGPKVLTRKHLQAAGD